MNWEEDKNEIIPLYYDCIQKNNAELFSILISHSTKVVDIYPLAKFIIERLNTVWFLTLQDMVWDAEIIARTALESLMKFTFIATATDDSEYKIRLNEFWKDLGEINQLKQSEDSKKYLSHFMDNLSQFAHLGLVLSQSDEAKLRIKWNRKDRKMLECKWSFSEILFSLTENPKEPDFEMKVSLAYEYRMGSHVAHGDETGIGIISERASRSNEDKKVAHTAHVLKLMNTCLSYSSFLSITAMEFLKEDGSFFINNCARIEEITDLAKNYHQEVFNDPIYNKYK
jgi:hypothetical protein